MAFTRYHYDEKRVSKLLQESTGPCRRILNTPGPGVDLPFFEDPHIRMSQWGANLMGVRGGHAVDIASDLDGRTRKYMKYDLPSNAYTKRGRPDSYKKTYKTAQAYTEESRASHPAWMYRSVVKPNWEYPLYDHQSAAVQNIPLNKSSRVLAKEVYEQ